MKGVEYMVDASTGRWGANPLQDWLNEKAKHGWRLVSAFWTAHQELFFVFERETNEANE